MCLQAVDDDAPKKEGFGWKRFARRKGRLRRLFPGRGWAAPDEPYRIGKWHEAAETVLLAFRGKRYPSGFHIFRRKRDAERWFVLHNSEVRRVAFADAHTQGLQDTEPGRRTVVAQRMRILPRRAAEEPT